MQLTVNSTELVYVLILQKYKSQLLSQLRYYSVVEKTLIWYLNSTGLNFIGHAFNYICSIGNSLFLTAVRVKFKKPRL